MKIMLAATALALVGALAGAQDAPSKLPIAVPKGASVEFEMDAPGKELMPLIRHYLANDSEGGKITVHTGAGDVNLKASEVEDILKQIRELHVVDYTGSKEPNPLGMHEAEFTGQGMHKVARIGGDKLGGQEVLIMVRRRSLGQYALVLNHAGHVTVVRTEGVPDLGEITQVLLQAVAGVAKDAILAKTHHHG